MYRFFFGLTLKTVSEKQALGMGLPRDLDDNNAQRNCHSKTKRNSSRIFFKFKPSNILPNKLDEEFVAIFCIWIVIVDQNWMDHKHISDQWNEKLNCPVTTTETIIIISFKLKELVILNLHRECKTTVVDITEWFRSSLDKGRN